MKKISKRLLVMLTAFAIAFTFIPVATGDFNAYAASKGPATVKSLTGTTIAKGNSRSVELKWKKIKGSYKGYAIYRDGKILTHVKKVAKYTDKSVKPGKTYKYTVKAYKVVKQKQWFNKQTQKWQTKKPAKKYRGKTRKVSVKVYGKGPTVTRNIKALSNGGSSNTNTNTNSGATEGTTHSYTIGVSNVKATEATITISEISGNPTADIYVGGNKVLSLNKANPSGVVTGLTPNSTISVECRMIVGGKDTGRTQYLTVNTPDDVKLGKYGYTIQNKEINLYWEVSGSIKDIKLVKEGDSNEVSLSAEDRSYIYTQADLDDKPTFTVTINSKYGKTYTLKIDTAKTNNSNN